MPNRVTVECFPSAPIDIELSDEDFQAYISGEIVDLEPYIRAAAKEEQ